MYTCGAAEDKVSLHADFVKEDGFAYVSRSRKNDFYTPIVVGDYVLQAFVDRDGLPAFRMYGTIDNKSGYYPVSLTVADETAGAVVSKAQLLSGALAPAPQVIGGLCKAKSEALLQAFFAARRKKAENPLDKQVEKSI